MNDVGLSVVEGVANGQSAFREPSKRNIGLLMQSTRGVPNTATKITSVEDFNVIFGGQNPNFFGPAIVKSIFDEAGDIPVTLYLCRVAGTGAVVAKHEATISAVAVTIRAARKGTVDPGVWGNTLTAAFSNYGLKSKGNFALEVFKSGALVETFYGETVALLQAKVNKASNYITAEFAAEIPKMNYGVHAGTVSTTGAGLTLLGVGTSFLTTVVPGTVIYDGAGTNAVIGTVLSIQDDTHLTFKSPATIVTEKTWATNSQSTYSLPLTGGANGTVVEADFYPVESMTNPTGLACFTGKDIQIIACTEFHSLTMAKVLDTYLRGQEGPLGVINLPLGATEFDAEEYATELQLNGISYMAGAYLGWAKVSDSVGNSLLIPAIGPILGAAYLRTPNIQGDYIHIPPGGTDSVFKYVTDMIPQQLSQPLINKLVRDFSCNVVNFSDSVGFFVGSSRTYSTDPLYQSIHIRQQTSFYKKLLGIKMLYVEQKSNTPELKREALIDLRTFFKTEYDNGALERSVPFDTAYQGICDRSNNPTSQDRKTLNIDALWIPTECTEAVKISLKRNDGILTVN